MRLTNILNGCVVLTLSATILAGCGHDNKKNEKEADKSAVNNIAIDDSLRNGLTEFASKPRTKGQFAFSVYDLTADKPVYSFNENKALPVASCLKLLSGVAGLHLLGTRYMYATSIYARGKVENGTLHGDVAFKGDLDPQLNAPDLAEFVKALKRKGIKRMDGKMILDLLLKDPVKSEAHWYPWDLSFSRYGLLYKGTPRIMKEMKFALRNQGISVADSQLVLGRVPRGSHCLFRFYRSVGLVIERMWKHSSNTQATSLLYTIGHRVNPNGTLRNELNDVKLRGKIHGKTGTLSHPYGISSLAGYCKGGNGHTLAFAIIDSEMSVLDARVLQDRLCRILVDTH
jgi:D-alanyl-D-alanine carboxypeptidase/D-alanyl-D-alanine-endopeptidase (penicillin-binding protein 4)